MNNYESKSWHKCPKCGLPFASYTENVVEKCPCGADMVPVVKKEYDRLARLQRRMLVKRVMSCA